jgi:predicted transcriptional regulator
METERLRKSLHDLIDQIEDAELLAAVYKIVAAKQEGDRWDNLDVEEKNAIKEGLEDLEKGNLLSHDEVMKEVKKLLKFS